MSNDGIDLLKHGFLAVLFIVCWFALVSTTHNIAVQMLLGWLGLGLLVLYFRWLKRHKLRSPKP